MRIINPEDLSTIKDSDFVVVKWKRNNEKTVVMEYSKGNFISARLSMDSTTWEDKWQEPSKAAYCAKANRHADAQSIVFENFREMVIWLAKEEKDGR